MNDRRETLFEAERFRIERVVQVTPDGVEHPRQVIRHPGAVAILPLMDDGRVCMIRNHRIAIEKTLYEIPAGTLESGEDPAEAALRELTEETGYRAERIEHLASFYTSPGMLDELMHLYLATGLEPGELALEPGEGIEPFPMDRHEALAMARDGRIEDGKTLTALMYYELFGTGRV